MDPQDEARLRVEIFELRQEVARLRERPTPPPMPADVLSAIAHMLQSIWLTIWLVGALLIFTAPLIIQWGIKSAEGDGWDWKPAIGSALLAVSWIVLLFRIGSRRREVDFSERD